MEPVLDDLDNITEHLNEKYSLLNHVDNVYKRVVDSLVNCAKMFIPKNSIISTNFTEYKRNKSAKMKFFTPNPCPHLTLTTPTPSADFRTR